MKIGIMPFFVDPYITDVAWVTEFLRESETAGAESVWTCEHPIIAEDYQPLYEYSADGRAPMALDTAMPDPLDWLAFAAGISSTLKLGTGVLLLPLQSPVMLAKRVASIDRLSGGRMLLGVGLGWQIEEFQAMHVPYNERGKRMDEGIAAMRALWAPGASAYRGDIFRFEKLHMHPKPKRNVPIIIGGSTEAAAKRAGRLGDGFYPHAISPEDFARRLDTMRAAAKEAGRDAAQIELTIAPWAYRNSTWDLGVIKAYAALGVTRFLIGPMDIDATAPAEYGRMIRRFKDSILAKI